MADYPKCWLELSQLNPQLAALMPKQVLLAAAWGPSTALTIIEYKISGAQTAAGTKNNVFLLIMLLSK